jgi:hypothetical protein
MYRHYNDLATSSADALFKGLGTSFGKQASDLLERGDFKSVVSLRVDPSAYSDASEFRDDYLVAELMSKFPEWDLGIDRVAVAISKFRESEQVCSETNSRLTRAYGTASTTVSASSMLYSMRRKIERLLGPFSWDEAERHFGFGPGSTTSLRRTCGDAYFKLGASRPHVTRESMVLAFCAVLRRPRWFASLAGLPSDISDTQFRQAAEFYTPYDLFEIVPGNHVTTVPKNAKTDRVIAKEPDLNMFLQKGLGGVIRRRLKRVGVDLDDQTLNQRLAESGSRDGTLATIDLSSASDTVALQLVREVMPPDWFAAIELCRSPKGILPSGDVITYQKVSSMGNGFTFELESLIFWALISTVLDYSSESDRRIAVYGDDLIIPVSIYEPVVNLLSYCGFSVNEKKSFATGQFRESCGKHYFSGFDVTPFYIRKSVENPQRIIWLANSVRRHARKGMAWGLDARFAPLHAALVSKLPSFWRSPRIPDNLGDIALIGDFDECAPKRAPHQFEGWKCMGVVERSSTFLADDSPMLLKALYELDRRSRVFSGSENADDVQDFIDQLVVRGSDAELGINKPRRRIAYQVVRPVSQQWESFGPWL